MLLTREELQRLVGVRERAPHHLLGLHPLGDGTGLVARVLMPDAAEIELHPVNGSAPGRPSIRLDRIPKSDIFEGTTTEATRVFPYELWIKAKSGSSRKVRDPYSFLPTLGDSDLYLFGKGDERRLYEKLGSQLRAVDGVAGTSFAVWAPNAQRVSVVGDFNDWDGRCHPMRSLGSSGVWEIFLPGIGEGAHYKYEVRTLQGQIGLRTDPFGFYYETPPKNASIVWNNRKFQWTDD